MEYTSRTVRCNEPGLTQEQALSSLYTYYGDDIRIASAKRRGDAWVVSFQQKIADFPPKTEEPDAPDAPPKGPPSDDAPDASGDEAPDAVDGGPPMGDEGEGDEGKEKPEAEILHLLHEIAMALGISGGLDDKLPPEGEHPGDLPPGPDAGMDPAMGGPPMGDGGPPAGPPARRPTKLKPGEVLPSQTPVGAPAFASTITVQSGIVDPRTYHASRAQAELEAGFAGYAVKQLTFDKTARVYRALLSTH